MGHFNKEQISEELQSLPEWKLDIQGFIVRTYRLSTFMGAINFVNEIAMYADEKRHHPLISVDYKKVTLKLSTLEETGLTDIDFILAQEFDLIYNQFIM